MIPLCAALSTPKITVLAISTKEDRVRWDSLIDERHYLRNHRMVGEQVRHVAVDEMGEWVALLGWSAGCARLCHRESWMGWDEGQRRSRLHLVACNARFLMLGGRGEQPNRASQVLARSMDRLPADWEERYGHPVLIAETFVDLKRPIADGKIEEFAESEAGTCYRAVGFTAVGRTRGFRRTREGFTRHGIERLLLVREIVPDARALLRNITTPWDRNERVTPATQINILDLPAAFDKKLGLVPHLLAHIPDPRERKQYSWSCILVGLMGGILAGETTVKGIAGWARALPESIIERIGGRLKKGKRTMPVANTYRYALEHVELDTMTTAIRAWLTTNDIDWAGQLIHVDGKVLTGAAKCGPGISTAAAFVGSHRALIAMTAHAGDEQDAVRRCLKQIDIRGCTVTADALHTNMDTSMLITQKGGSFFFKSKETNQNFYLKSKN